MLTVCNKHVKTVLKRLTVPHVKKIESMNYFCLFCKKKATIKLYNSIPVSFKNISKI